MVRRSRARLSSLFLIELILAILFFSVASAVCVQLFVKAHLLSRDSNALNHAVNECASVAEIVDGAGSAEEVTELLERLYPEGEASESYITIAYDENFNPCEDADAAYSLTVHLTEENNMVSAQIRMMDAKECEKVIYGLDTTHHVANQTEYAAGRDDHAER